MFPTDRQAEILRLLDAERTCSVTELAARFGVSDETIRRDLKPLIADHRVRKVHGGVTLPGQLDEPPFQRRMEGNRAAKRAIAARVARHVEDGDSLILDGGTTCLYVAQALASARARLTVITHSAEVARVLAPVGGNRVFITGGELRGDDLTAFGDSVAAFLRQFHVRRAIVSVTAIDAAGRFMDALPADVAYAQTAFAQADECIVAADHTKFGHSALLHAFGPEAPDLVVTDRAPPEAVRAALADVPVVIAG